MANDSTTSGFLAPIASDPYDAALEDLLQATVVGISGLAGNLVRPRWQPDPPSQPAFNVDWVAFGIVRSVVDPFAFENHQPEDAEGQGTTQVERTETLYVLHSFYGPNSHSMAERFRDGFELTQNRDQLRASGLLLVEVEEAVMLPALLKEKWVKRVDVNVIYRRMTRRKYQIRNILSGHLGLDNEHYVTPINVTS